MEKAKIFNSTFREEVVEILMSAGIKEDKALNVVRTRYKEALKEAAIARLTDVINNIKNGKYESIETFSIF